MPRPLHSLLDRFIDQFANAVFERAQEKFGSLRGGGGRAGLRDGRRAGRLCPVPNCGKPGAGPRNRWFCKEHAKSLPVSEQRRLLTVAREKGAELRRAESRKRRGGAGRKLDMSCRVAGCKNTSRGPRFGFICDKHRKELSAKEQQAARDKWNEAHKKAA